MNKINNRDELPSKDNKIRLITYFISIFAHVTHRMASLGENGDTLNEMQETIALVMTRLQVTLFPELKTVGELLALMENINVDVDIFKDSMVYRQNINTDLPN